MMMKPMGGQGSPRFGKQTPFPYLRSPLGGHWDQSLTVLMFFLG